MSFRSKHSKISVRPLPAGSGQFSVVPFPAPSPVWSAGPVPGYHGDWCVLKKNTLPSA